MERLDGPVRTTEIIVGCAAASVHIARAGTTGSHWGCRNGIAARTALKPGLARVLQNPLFSGLDDRNGRPGLSAVPQRLGMLSDPVVVGALCRRGLHAPDPDLIRGIPAHRPDANHAPDHLVRIGEPVEQLLVKFVCGVMVLEDRLQVATGLSVRLSRVIKVLASRDEALLILTRQHSPGL